jgi:hypothetical protein
MAMKYNSVGEYFYKLSNRCLGLVLLPVLFILIANFFNQHFLSGLALTASTGGILVEVMTVEGSVFIILFGVMQMLVALKLKPLRNDPSLSNRISGYIPIVMIRFRFLSIMILVIGTCVFLIGDLILLAPLPFIAVLTFIYWPFNTRLARDLKLKPEEWDILKNKSLGV